MPLDAWLRQNGWPRAQLARALGISSGHVTDLCNNRYWPSLSIVLKIRRLTGGEVTANDFLPEDKGPDDQGHRSVSNPQRA